MQSPTEHRQSSRTPAVKHSEPAPMLLVLEELPRTTLHVILVNLPDFRSKKRIGQRGAARGPVAQQQQPGRPAHEEQRLQWSDFPHDRTAQLLRQKVREFLDFLVEADDVQSGWDKVHPGIANATGLTRQGYAEPANTLRSARCTS